MVSVCLANRMLNYYSIEHSLKLLDLDNLLISLKQDHSLVFLDQDLDPHMFLDLHHCLIFLDLHHCLILLNLDHYFI